MGFMDAFTTDAPVTIKHNEFYELVKEAAKAELMMNAINCDVPHKYIREIMTGQGEIDVTELMTLQRGQVPIHPDRWSCDTCSYNHRLKTECDTCEDDSNYQAAESEGREYGNETP